MRIRTGTHRVVAVIAGVFAVLVAASGCSGLGRVAVEVPTQVETALAPETTQQLEASVAFAMAASGSPGAIVGVWAPWSGSWVAGLGAQSAGGAAVKADMDFRIADVTRAMTCDVLYAAIAAGDVDLDDPVTDYVTGIPQLSDISLGQLCDGTSSIGNYADELQALWLANPSRTWNPRELVAYGLGHSPDPLTPGSGYADSDSGYLLLGLAMERVTGKSAAEMYEDSVFGPLGMTGTALPRAAAAPPQVSGTALTGHYSLPGPDGVMNCTEPLDVTSMSSSIGFTDSGVVSNLTDVRRYAQALATGALLDDGQNRFDGALPANPGAPSWFTSAGGAYQAGSLIGQHGAVPGYATAAYADPTSGLTVVVVLNNSAIDAGVVAALAWELAAIASKAPSVGGGAAPEAGLPWTAQQFHDQIAAAAICPLPAP